MEGKFSFKYIFSVEENKEQKLSSSGLLGDIENLQARNKQMFSCLESIRDDIYNFLYTRKKKNCVPSSLMLVLRWRLRHLSDGGTTSRKITHEKLLQFTPATRVTSEQQKEICYHHFHVTKSFAKNEHWKRQLLIYPNAK